MKSHNGIVNREQQSSEFRLLRNQEHPSFGQLFFLLSQFSPIIVNPYFLIINAPFGKAHFSVVSLFFSFSCWILLYIKKKANCLSYKKDQTSKQPNMVKPFFSLAPTFCTPCLILYYLSPLKLLFRYLLMM